MQKAIRRLSLSLDGTPIYLRTTSPDEEVINEVLVREEYDLLGQDLTEAVLIVDCGAYAGYSSLYFLRKYKNAHVIAIEPDHENFELCSTNLQPYGNRVTLVHAAVWPEASELTLHKGELGDGREWATMVQLPKPNETPDVMGVNLGTLLRDSGFTNIDLLKMNVECAEEAVFSRNYEKWLPHVKNIIIQLHDRNAEDAFFRAVSDYQLLLARSPGLFACTLIAPRAPGKPPVPTQPEDARNALTNGDFENLRVQSAQIVPGGWIPGSTDVALSWQIVVSDPPFHTSLAVRTGRQRSGDNALLIRMNPEQSVPINSAPYAAIENRTTLPVREGEEWRIRAFVKTSQTAEPLPGTVRGAYVFLRLLYDDASTADLRTAPLLEATCEYAEMGGILQIPQSAPGRALVHATLWLYVWIENPDPVEVPAAAYGTWEVLFDNVSAAKS